MIQVTSDNIGEVLSYINPATLSYQEWIAVGMALKDEGFDCSVWEQWSRNDSRFHDGECEKKWATFRGSSGQDITFATVMRMAFDGGFRDAEREERAFDWDDEIGKRDDYVVVDKNWIESREVRPPHKFDPVKELTTYLETLFDSTEIVGFVTKTWEKDGKFLPTKGDYTRTAGSLIEELSKCKGDIGAVIGDYNEKAGAWIRFNPLDGKGVMNDNVTDFRYALVESDEMEIDTQNAIIRQMELPVAALVYSGGKSLHAIVKIEATDIKEYRKRVDFLYSVCKDNGLIIDTANRNPSRLSRMPGIIRGDKKQFLVDTNIGKATFKEWEEWIKAVNDDLPDPEPLSSCFDDLPELAPPLIDGVLRQGHKMLLAGPSKAGKSYALIELCCAIAEGKPWLGFNCAKGKVMYVNLELDRASCLHRFKDVYTALGWEPNNVASIDIWNLRGRTLPMDKLAPKLIRRAYKKDYIAIIIDPIYKVITGDENSADQMARFCNQFDKVCNELGCAVIYCHHHSKGRQDAKRSMDRASGSGVFARDPDALLDIIELPITDADKEAELERNVIRLCTDALQFAFPDSWQSMITDELQKDGDKMLAYCRQKLDAYTVNRIEQSAVALRPVIEARTAWRIEATLREFPKPAPLNLWFEYPVHRFDSSGKLKGVELEEGYTKRGSPYNRNFKQKKTNEKRKADRVAAIEQAYNGCKLNDDDIVTVKDIMGVTGHSEDTVRRHLKEAGFGVEDGEVWRKA